MGIVLSPSDAIPYFVYFVPFYYKFLNAVCSLLPVPRRPVSRLVSFLFAHERAVFSVAVPAFALKVIDAGGEVEPDDSILRGSVFAPAAPLDRELSCLRCRPSGQVRSAKAGNRK